MKYYYADANNQPVGPLSLAEMRALVSSGKIEPDVMIRSEESDTPQALSSFPDESIPPAPAPSPTSRAKLPASTLLGDSVTTALGHVSRLLNPKLIERGLGYARDIGHYVVLAGGALILIYAIFAAIKFDSFSFLLAGIGFLAALAVAQFAAKNFLGAGEVLIANTPSRISSPALLDCVGLLTLLGALAAFFGGLVVAIQANVLAPFISGLLAAVLLVFAGAVALHPKLVNIEESSGSAGEEAIGYLTFVLKAGLKLVPLFFFVLATLGCLVTLFSFTDAGGRLAGTVGFIPGVGYGTPPGFAGAGALIAACLLPMVAYLLFLIAYLVFDLIRSVLAIPGKLDRLRR